MSPPTVPTRFVLASEITEMLCGCNEGTVHRLALDEGLPSHMVGRRRMFDPAEVEAWVRSRGALGVTDDPYRAAIRKLVDEAPPITADQAAKVRAVLLGGHR